MKGFKLTVSVLMAVGLVLAIGLATPSFAKTKKWKMAAILTPDDPMTMYAIEWAKEIEEKTDGGIVIKVYHSGTLGHERETAEQMTTGALECGILTNAVLANFSPSMGIYNLPYVFTSIEQGLAFDATPEAEQLAALFRDESGIELIGTYPGGFRNIMNSKHPVNSPADLEGLKLRVMENKVHVASLNAMGATATPISWNEVIPSIQTNVIDGFENSITTFSAVKIWELLKHLAMTKHLYDVAQIVIAGKAWDSLTDGEKQIIRDAHKKTMKAMLKILDQKKKEGLEQMKKNGVQITYPDLAPFVEKVKPVQEDFLEDHPKLEPIMKKALSLQ